MAYLRKEKEIVEIDYSIDAVWRSVLTAISNLEWTIEEKDDSSYRVKTKTKSNFMAYASSLTINATSESENTTKIILSAETPVTTITGIVDFGRTRERIDSFLLALLKVIKSQETGKKP